jgi:very-short-patch-repair endonuclease
VITTAQLNAAGLGRNGLAQRVKARRLHPLYRGVYAVGHNRLSQQAKWMAAVLAAGEGAVLSHVSAAKHWNVWRGREEGIDVLVPGNRRGRAGFRVHRARRLNPRDVTTHQGLPITTVPRTLIDLAQTLTPHQLANVIHEAAFRTRFEETSTRQAMARAKGRDLTNLHAALQAHAAGSAGTKSALEDAFLARATGDPLVNHKIEVDFYWPDRNLVVEIDGPGHERPRTRNEDAARDAALNAAGIKVVRIPSGDGR